MRPYWKGYLKLALVSCPIALHAACSTAERIGFRQINKATGNRLRQQLIDEETREPVEPEHKGRGYEVAKGQYLIVEDEELEAIEIESTHVIEIDSFVPRQQIDQRFFDTPYYVAPNEPVAQEAFAVIREAMRHKTMVALGRLVLSKRERVIALEPYGKGLLGTTLRYPYEVRDAKDYFADLPELALAPDMLTLAEHILKSKVADFDPKAFRDRYEEALLAHLKAKQAGAVPEEKPPFAAPRRVINLMEALRRSIAQDQKPAGKGGSAPSATRKRAYSVRSTTMTAPRLPNHLIRSIWCWTASGLSVRPTAKPTPGTPIGRPSWPFSCPASMSGPCASWPPPKAGHATSRPRSPRRFWPSRTRTCPLRCGTLWSGPDERIARQAIALRRLHPQVDRA